MPCVRSRRCHEASGGRAERAEHCRATMAGGLTLQCTSAWRLQCGAYGVQLLRGRRRRAWRRGGQQRLDANARISRSDDETKLTPLHGGRSCACRWIWGKNAHIWGPQVAWPAIWPDSGSAKLLFARRDPAVRWIRSDGLKPPHEIRLALTDRELQPALHALPAQSAQSLARVQTALPLILRRR